METDLARRSGWTAAALMSVAMVVVVYAASATATASILAAESTAGAVGLAFALTRCVSRGCRVRAAAAGTGHSAVLVLAGLVSFGVLVAPALVAWSVSWWSLLRVRSREDNGATGFALGFAAGAVSLLVAVTLAGQAG